MHVPILDITRLIVKILLPVPISKVFECEVLDVLYQIFVTRMNGELTQNLDEDQAEDELDGQVAFLGHELQLGTGATQFAANAKNKQERL